MKWAGELMRKKLSALGEPVDVVFPGETVRVQALIYPVTSISEAAKAAKSQWDGAYAPGTYAYFGPAETDIGESRYLICGGQEYFVRRSEIFRVGGKDLYCWGLLLGGVNDEAAGCYS